MSKFTDQAESLKTSPEIMLAIDELAKGDFLEAMKIWNFPTWADLRYISSRVTQNGERLSSEFVWWDYGRDWLLLWANEISKYSRT